MVYKSLIFTSCFLWFGLQPLTAETATFAGGCFWCMEPLYDGLHGVNSTRVGYAGGQKENSTYEEVSSGATKHTEAIEVEYDPTTISYEQLLEIFWHNVDPTAKDHQFCDSGKQYRSAIFYHNPQQKFEAEASKKRVIEEYNIQPIETEIVAATPFYPAEEYHQKYYKKNPTRYKVYRYLCGRDKRLKEIWGDPPKSLY